MEALNGDNNARVNLLSFEGALTSQDLLLGARWAKRFEFFSLETGI